MNVGITGAQLGKDIVIKDRSSEGRLGEQARKEWRVLLCQLRLKDHVRDVREPAILSLLEVAASSDQLLGIGMNQRCVGCEFEAIALGHRVVQVRLDDLLELYPSHIDVLFEVGLGHHLPEVAEDVFSHERGEGPVVPPLVGMRLGLLLILLLWLLQLSGLQVHIKVKVSQYFDLRHVEPPPNRCVLPRMSEVAVIDVQGRSLKALALLVLCELLGFLQDTSLSVSIRLD
jgi:hypothetical protein